VSGLYNKFNVTKVDGETDPNARYFVLRLDNDSRAVSAVMSWAIDSGLYELHDDIAIEFRGMCGYCRGKGKFKHYGMVGDLIDSGPCPECNATGKKK